MNYEGEKGTENVAMVEKLESLDIGNKEISHNPDSKTYFPSGYDPLKKTDDSETESKSPQLCNFSERIVSMVANKEETTKDDDKFKLLTNKKSTNHNIYFWDKKLKAWLDLFGDPPMEESKPMKKYVEKRAEAIEAATEAIEATATEHYIPPHNVEATSVDMAYPLEKIIFEEDWEYLVDIFELVESGSEVSPDVYPTFVCNRAHAIGAIKDEKKRRTMAGILSYITHLIKYKDMHSFIGVSSTGHHKLPSFLAKRFSSLFCETEHKYVPAQKQLLLISYVLVLSLFADDFRSDPSDIAKDLRMSPKLLRRHYDSLGCKFSKEIATLSVPLELPTRKRRRIERVGIKTFRDGPSVF